MGLDYRFGGRQGGEQNWVEVRKDGCEKKGCEQQHSNLGSPAQYLKKQPLGDMTKSAGEGGEVCKNEVARKTLREGASTQQSSTRKDKPATSIKKGKEETFAKS